MKIYILRHAIAVDRGTAAFVDDDRPLTVEGKEKMSKAAKGMASLITEIDLILTSPLIRAHDTARIAARALRAEQKVQICKELSSGGSVKNLMTYLSKFRGLNNIMLVGHQPDLGFIASLLLGSESSIIQFKKGSLCCIEVSTLPPRSKGTLIWHLQPKHLRALA
jgi:phosphohistidine phosphatase